MRELQKGEDKNYEYDSSKRRAKWFDAKGEANEIYL